MVHFTWYIVSWLATTKPEFQNNLKKKYVHDFSRIFHVPKRDNNFNNNFNNFNHNLFLKSSANGMVIFLSTTLLSIDVIRARLLSYVHVSHDKTIHMDLVALLEPAGYFWFTISATDEAYVQ